MNDLFTPGKIGSYQLANRAVMAPMTRNRASEDFIPRPMSVEYYAQRATAGLVITEAAQVSPQGAAYPRTPGIYNPAQVDAWRPVVAAVHQRGAKIFMQLWHGGRISHPSIQPQRALPVAPSALRAEGEIQTHDGLQSYVTPRALETDEVASIVEQFRSAAAHALATGFDGVELHAANGYLLDQFLRSGSNQRTDRYGGSVVNRCRLLLEVIDAVNGIWGAQRVGVRISPRVDAHSVSDPQPAALFGHLADALNAWPLAYLHVFESLVPHRATPSGEFDLGELRRRFRGPYIANGGYDAGRATQALGAGRADFVSFARLYLANPDLLDRFRTGARLNEPDMSTFYRGDERGYTDYPTLDHGAGR